MSATDGIINCWTRDAALVPKVGGIGEFGFYERRMVIKVKVAEVSPPGHMVWDPVSSTGGGFDGTTIGFDHPFRWWSQRGLFLGGQTNRPWA